MKAYRCNILILYRIALYSNLTGLNNPKSEIRNQKQKNCMNTSQRLFRNFLVLCCMQLLPALAWAQSERPFPTNPQPKSVPFKTEDEYDKYYGLNVWDFGESDTYGTPWNPIKIDSEQSLMNLVYNVNYRGKTYKGVYFKLTKDIVINYELLTDDGLRKKTDEDRPNRLNLTNWWPIGRYCTIIDDYFGGCFDGDGHTITGLFLDNGYEPNGDTDKSRYIGLFGKIKNATIKNLTLRECYLGNTKRYDPQATYYGTLVGYAAGTCTIENCHIEKTLFETICNLRTGGLVGYLESGTISGCTFNGTIINQIGGKHFDRDDYRTGIHYGGIVGEVENGLVENCKVEGTVTYNAVAYAGGFFTMDLGGICGLNKGLIKACTSNLTYNFVKNNDAAKTDKLSTNGSTFFLGGVAGINEGTIQECAAKGTFSVGYAWVDANRCNEYPSTDLYICGIANLGKGGVIQDCANFTSLTVDESFSEKSTYAGIGQRTWEDGNNKKAAIRRCISASNAMNNGTVNWAEVSGKGKTNKFRYAAIAAPDDYLYIENSYCFTDKDRKTKTMLDEKELGVNIYPNLSDMKQQNPFNSTGIWGTWPANDASVFAQCPLPLAVGGEVTDLRGSGTEEAPFLIANAAELNKAADLINDEEGIYDHAYYKLEADIFMGSTALRAIGRRDKPFRGTFNGAGHYISNLITQEGYMFKYLYGTVKNLSLVDCKGKIGGDEFAGIVYELGAETEGNKGLVSNCYVGADVHLYRMTTDQIEDLDAAGICLRLKSFGTIENCYVAGNITFEARTVDGKKPGGMTTTPATYAEAGGIVNTSLGGTIRNCYAVTNYEAIGWEYPNPAYIKPVGLVYECLNGFTTTINNCRYYNPNVDKAVYSNSNNTDLSTATRVESEAELANYFNAAPWKAGFYRPVLEGTKTYAATTPEGEATCIDAIPTAPKQQNYFLKVNLSPSDFNSDFLEKFQGVAFHSPSQKSDYLLNWNINPDADWKYVPTKDATVKGRASLTIKRSESYNKNGWFMLCLPGEVNLSDLPKGSKVYVVGAVNEAAKTANIVEVKTIPAGVPFLLYLPEKVSSTTTNSNGETTTTELTVENVNLIMEGEFATATKLTAENSALVGTGNFTRQTLNNVCTTINETTTEETITEGSATEGGTTEGGTTEGGTTEGSTTEGTTTTQEITTRTAIATHLDVEVKPFSAYINYNENVELADYLLLDEKDPKVDELIKSNNGKKVRVKLLRKLKAGQWNTLCLPFEPTSHKIKTIFGENTVVNYYYYYANHQNGTMTIQFRNFDLSTSEWNNGGVFNHAYFITGCPYLIKPEKVNADGIYDFGEVTISSKLNWKFHDRQPDLSYLKGTFAPSELRSNEENYTYFIQGDKIYFVPLNEMVPMLGFRAYLNLPVSLLTWDSSSGAMVKEFIIEYGDGTTTHITPEPLAPSTQMPAAVYDLQGRRLARPGAKGIYIIGNQKIIK